MSSVNPTYHHTPDRLRAELEWIERAKGDPRHFAPLYEKYHEQIFRYVYQRMDEPELADDVTSQVFFKAIKNIHRFEYRGVPFGSWLYRIAKSELNQAFRDRKAKRTINIDMEHVAVFMEVFEQEENQINLKKLKTALVALGEEDVQLIEMRFFEDRPYKEIAEIIGITENNAKVKTFRALEKLKKIFFKK